MDRELTSEEKRFVEREFVVRQEAAAKRRSFARAVFLIGISAGCTAALLRGLEVRFVLLPLLSIGWLICLVVYVGGQIIPASFGKDMDVRWHLNFWQEALQSLSESRTQVEAIALLAAPWILQMLASILYLSIK